MDCSHVVYISSCVPGGVGECYGGGKAPHMGPYLTQINIVPSLPIAPPTPLTPLIPQTPLHSI